MAQHWRDGAVAGQKLCQLFAMGEIESAASGQQKLPCHGGHMVVDGDGGAGAGQDLCGHQPCGTAADDGGGRAG